MVEVEEAAAGLEKTAVVEGASSLNKNGNMNSAYGTLEVLMGCNMVAEFSELAGKSLGNLEVRA